MDDKTLTLEEKVDLLLAYQKKQNRYALFSLIMSILAFLLLVVLPLIGLIWIGDYLKSSLHVDPSQFEESLNDLKQLLDSK